MLGQTVPDLLGESHAVAARQDSGEARRLLADTLHAALRHGTDLGRPFT